MQSGLMWIYTYINSADVIRPSLNPEIHKLLSAETNKTWCNTAAAAYTNPSRWLHGHHFRSGSGGRLQTMASLVTVSQIRSVLVSVVTQGVTYEWWETQYKCWGLSMCWIITITTEEEGWGCLLVCVEHSDQVNVEHHLTIQYQCWVFDKIWN